MGQTLTLAELKEVVRGLRELFSVYADYMSDQPLSCVGTEIIALAGEVHPYRSVKPAILAVISSVRHDQMYQARAEWMTRDALLEVREEVNRLASEIEEERSFTLAQKLADQLLRLVVKFAIGTRARVRRLRKLVTLAPSRVFEEDLSDLINYMRSRPLLRKSVKVAQREADELIKNSSQPLKKSIKAVMKELKKGRNPFPTGLAMSCYDVESVVLDRLLLMSDEPFRKFDAVVTGASQMEAFTPQQADFLRVHINTRLQIHIEDGRATADSEEVVGKKAFQEELGEAIGHERDTIDTDILVVIRSSPYSPTGLAVERKPRDWCE